MQDSASGQLPTLLPNTMDSSSSDAVDVTYPTMTTGPSTTPTTQDLQISEWLSSTLSWGSDFTQWESFARSQSGLQLPSSTINEITVSLENAVEAATVRANSAAWLSLLNNWNQGYGTYTGTFSGVCPQL